VERTRRISTFSADVTIPIGHPCMGGGIAPASEVVDPLEAIGFVLSGGDLDKPVVMVSVDWCEIRNDAYDLWRDTLAAAAGTDRGHVFVSAVHQHDAPVVDPEAQRILESYGARGAVCDVAFNEEACRRVGLALEAALARPSTPVSHIGIGAAKVESVASNRRYPLPDGTISYHRTSASTAPEAHDAPEGTIDPWLTTLSFWNGDQPILALSHYAVHPMSYYGRGGVSADFVGLARRARQRALPDVVQVYVSGCSGNVTAGKYNDGSPDNRPVLAGRMEAAMARAWDATERWPLETATWRSVPLTFEPRRGPGYSEAGLIERILNDPVPYGQCLAAMGLSWRRRNESGRLIDMPVLDLGRVIVVLLPGESYVEYQLLARRLRPDAVVIAVGFGESATGYIPTSLQLGEGDENLGDWYWVSETAEQVLTDGLERALVATP
jgi:hypothetical protein